MKKLQLQVTSYWRKSRKYNSYKGQIGKIAENKLKRHFTTTLPHQKITTDTTEFKYYEEGAQKKLYLNPFLDLFNIEIISYTISRRAFSWFEKYNINVQKYQISKMTRNDLVKLLQLSDEGLKDIIKRPGKSSSEVRDAITYMELLSFNEALDFVLSHPYVLQTPIIIDGNNYLIGYNEVSLSEFAESLGVTKSRVNMWENKGVIPRSDLLILIAQKYNTPLHVLLGVEEISSENKKQNSLFQFLLTLDDNQLEKAEKMLRIVFGDN